MGKKIAAFLLTAAMVLALLPMALAASNAADTAEFQFLLSPHAPDGKVVAADLLLRATAVETVNGFQMSFNGSAKLTGAAIEGARTTAASIGYADLGCMEGNLCRGWKLNADAGLVPGSRCGWKGQQPACACADRLESYSRGGRRGR